MMTEYVVCPYCKNQFSQLTYTHIKTHGKTMQEMRSEFYGIKIASDKVTNKQKETFLKKYGVDNPSRHEGCKEKRRNTTYERFGVYHVMSLTSIKNQIKNTMLERYGVENPSYSKEFLEKKEKTFFERYGGRPKTSDETKRKRKDTNIERYGFDESMRSPDIKKKYKNTILERYGVESNMHLLEVREKCKKTMLERYGAEYSALSKELLEKAKQTRIKNGAQVPDELLSLYSIYKRKVFHFTHKAKKIKFKKEELSKRGKSGMDGALQIDHIYSIFEGFINNISPEIIGHPANLQLTTWEYNDDKKSKSDITLNELYELIDDYKKGDNK